MSWTYFIRSDLTGYVFVKNRAWKYSICKSIYDNSISKESIQLSKSQLRNMSSYIERKLISTDKNIHKQLKEYKETLVCNLLIKQLQFPSEEIKNEVEFLLSKITKSETSLQSFMSLLLTDHELPYDDLFKNISEYQNGDQFLISIKKDNKIIRIKKAALIWNNITRISKVPSSALYYRAENEGFILSLIKYTHNDQDINSLFILFCRIIFDSTNNDLPLETLFLEALSPLSKKQMEISQNFKKYYKPIKPYSPLELYYMFDSKNLAYCMMKLQEKNVIWAANFAKDMGDRNTVAIAKDIEKSKTYLEQCFSEWNTQFFDICQNISIHLKNYFEMRDFEGTPRFSIKAIDEKDGTMYVNTFYRDHVVKYDQKTKLHENTGFLFCINTGQPYFNNDINLCESIGLYKNPRLKERIDYTASKLPKIDHPKEMKSRWMNGRNLDKYSSTLIFPIKTFTGSVSGNTITGFLCLDHNEKNFFNPTTDLRVMYMISSMIGTFLTSRNIVLLSGKIIKSLMLKIISKRQVNRRKLKIQYQAKQKQIPAKELHDSIKRYNSNKGFVKYIDRGLVDPRTDVE